ncbi:unnamed protein product [Caenorhabditis sp. 36 PRJEB53466]|nr:unnamed protein product [Caenorhabditis sp. 36 PRJEB53466]
MSRNIRTFRDLGDDDGPDSDDSGADAGPPQEFYAGSGQAVQGPRGARNPEDAQRAAQENHIRQILQAVQANPVEAAQGPNGPRNDENTLKLVLHLWNDGLSIEDGPLMSRQDRATIEFLDQVGRGEIPAEVARQYPGKTIDFQINRRREDYVAPKMRPFAGSGVRLGAVVPNIVGESSASAPAASSSSAAPTTASGASAAEEAARLLEDAKKELNTDTAQPTTNIQVRLPNNQRLVATFNQSHTLEAVRLFICTARPEIAYAPFQLMNAYPPKILEDETVSLKDANLLNSVIAVKSTPNA